MPMLASWRQVPQGEPRATPHQEEFLVAVVYAVQLPQPSRKAREALKRERGQPGSPQRPNSASVEIAKAAKVDRSHALAQS